MNLKILADDQMTIKQAMQRMSERGKKILFVVDQKQKLMGCLTDGDIRRFILANGKLTDRIAKIYNKKPVFISESFDLVKVKHMMVHGRLEAIPVVDKDNKLVDVLFWDDILGGQKKFKKRKISVPVIIMAGGKGTRLDPFTKILPKPLIPIGEKTILEMIMDKFKEYGVEKFYLSIHHKSELIKAYFKEIDLGQSIQYIEEKKPLGSAGSLNFLKSKMRGNFIVSNCDILIDGDYAEMLDFHQSHDNDLTVIGSFRHYTIPYGICHIENGGDLVDIEEKPEYDFLASTGMYVLNSRILPLIPKNIFFNMTDLIKLVKQKGGKVKVFPIHEQAWVDIGQLEEYRYTLKLLEKE